MLPHVRDAEPADFGTILSLNREWEHVTSPLDSEDLVRLAEEASLFRVAEVNDRIGAFLLAFTSGATYQSPNYLWFASRMPSFLYIDRIVVEGAAQRSGLGAALYEDAFAHARRLVVSRVVCEVDIEPMNAVSDAFHRRWGFTEVGTQWLADGAKQVSLRECCLDTA